MPSTPTRRKTTPSGTFTKVLLPIDLSDRHKIGLGLAGKLVGQGGGEVLLLHVIEVIDGLPPNEGKEFYGRLEKKARNHLDGLASGLNKSRVNCRVEVTYGHRVAEVVRYAAAMRADLIVVTAPPVDLKNVTAGWGSLSYRIGLVAPCPVLLVK